MKDTGSFTIISNTLKNTIISPNFLVWKLGEITVFFAVNTFVFIVLVHQILYMKFALQL